jgi:hypothetical protein
MAQKVGSVKPSKFRVALNEVILLATGVHPKTSLSERTARHWLVKLGFRRTIYRKGMYIDRHERPDVVKYRDEVFLPQMAEYERRMTQYVIWDRKLVAIPPTLADGEKEIIAEFHDECCFHAFDFLNSVWYAETFSSELDKLLMILAQAGSGTAATAKEVAWPADSRL